MRISVPPSTITLNPEPLLPKEEPLRLAKLA
jgi:hypothetical protein